MGWSLEKMIRTHLKPRSFSSRSQGNRTEDVRRLAASLALSRPPRFIELYASYGCGPAGRAAASRPPYAYRGDTLCLKDRSIGEGARLEC